VLDWPTLLRGRRTVTLALDESSQNAAIHLLRVSLLYWGGALPLAWRIWPQNVPQADGHYWQQVDAVLAELAALLPAGVRVVLVADRAYDIPPIVDRLTAYGWHWVLRAKAGSSLCFRDHRGQEHALKTLIARHVGRPGQRWKARGAVFKGAGWRAASVVAVWAPGQQQPLVVLTDLPPRWAGRRQYDHRFWIECGFRSDKSHGWQWEHSGVQGVGHHERLLLAMAWASLIALAIGVQHAQQRLAAPPPLRRKHQPRPGRPQRAKHSVFTLGLRALRAWLFGAAPRLLPWHLPELDAPSWLTRWHAHQAHRLLFTQTVRP
jgi:hypothetical protein